MSQPQAALYIQPPTLETKVAAQITAKATWRNGAENGGVLIAVEPTGGDFAITCPRGGRPGAAAGAARSAYSQVRYRLKGQNIAF